MKLLIQRVAAAQVDVEGRCIGRIERGLLVYVGVAAGDLARENQWRPLADKVAQLRIFEDDAGKMNLNVRDRTGGGGPGRTKLYAAGRRPKRPPPQLRRGRAGRRRPAGLRAVRPGPESLRTQRGPGAIWRG